MRGADGFMLAYDITSYQSFDEIQTWYDEILEVNSWEPENLPAVLIGNKVPLFPSPPLKPTIL